MDRVELEKYIIKCNTDLLSDAPMMELLEDKKGYSHSDVADYMIGYDIELNLYTMPNMNENEGYENVNKYDINMDKFDWVEDAKHHKEIELPHAANPDLIGQRITSTVVINGSFPSPFLIAKKITGYCEEAGQNKKCAACRLNGHANPDEPLRHSFNEKVDTSTLLQLVDTSETQVDGVLRKFFKVPAYNSCRLVNFNILTRHHVTILTVSPEIKRDKTDDVEYAQRKVYAFVAKEANNGIHRIWGTVIQDPGTQEAVLVVWKMKETTDVLARWKITPAISEMLSKFRPDEPDKLKSLLKKRDEFNRDIVDNITQIYDRDNLIQFFEFIALSPLHFKFLGKKIYKGWAEGLVSGDTRTGKTETLRTLSMHYRCGEFLTSGENSTAAGIMAGVQSAGSSGAWTVNWGALPLNDKKLLIIDEADTLAEKGILGMMSGARSSGIVEITKIKKFVALARTRLLFIANPLNGRVSEYAYGVQTVKELFKEQQDIARLDVATIVNEASVDKQVVNSRHDDKVEHYYDSDMCHQLAMYAWKRTDENVVWSRGTEDYILKETNRLSDKYSSDIPLVVASELRLTLAKFAIAAAVKFFSTEKDNDDILMVLKVHVEYAVYHIESEYDGDFHGYLDYSLDKKESMELDTPVLDRIIRNESSVKMFLSCDTIQHKDMEDILLLERDEARKAAGNLRKSGALRSVHQYYKKTTPFIKYLKSRKKKFRKRDKV